MSRRSGQIIARGDGRWLVRVYDGADAQGGRRYINETVHGTRRDAQAKLNELLRARDRGVLVRPTKETLGEFLDHWLDNTKARVLRARTLERYRDDVNRYVRPALGDRRLKDIRAEDIDFLYSSMNKRGLKARTIRHVHAVLSGALQQAVRWSRISRNPAKLVDLPSLERSAPRSLDTEQAKRFVVAAEQDRHGALLLLAISTGMRPGEYEALMWSAVDLDGKRVTVSQALVRLRGGGWRFESTKTGRTRRVVLSEPVVRALKSHRARQAEARLGAGGSWRDHDLVFCNEIGDPLQHGNLVSRHFKRVLQAAGLPVAIRLYDLRHTFGTLMVASGEDVRTVADVLGHSSPSTTLNVYAHALDENRRRAAERMEGLLFPKGGTDASGS